MSLVISLATMFGKTAAEKLFRALGNRRNGCSGEYQGVSPVHSGAPSRGVKQVIGYVKVMRWGFSSRSPTSDCNPYSESSLKAVKTTSELAGAAVSAYANPNILIDCSHNSDIFCLAHFLRISELDTAKQFIILMRRLTISVLMPFAFFGCAAVGVNDATGQKITDPNAAFAKGEIRLTCGLACSGAWGAVRNKLRQLHDNSLWSDLKLEVLKIGKEADLAYYYIGRAAEGEGNFDAAKIYYRLALAASFKCSGVINVCDKFVFPGDINIRLNSLPVTVRSDKISNAEQVSTEATGSKNIPAAVENNANPSISQLGMGAVDLGQEAKGIASKLVTKYDEFRKVTEYSGPNIAKKDVDVLMIRAWKGEGVEASFQIYVKHFHNDDWRFYSTAFDDTGRALDFTSISREIATCSHGTCFRREFFGLNIDRNYLVSKKNSGIRFKVFGKSTEEIYSISPSYVQAILSVVPAAQIQSELKLDADLKAAVNAEPDGNKSGAITPAQKYLTGFVTARVMCYAAKVLGQNQDRARLRGLNISSGEGIKGDVNFCIKEQLSNLEREYKVFLSLQKSKLSKDALTDHYVAAVLVVKGSVGLIGENDNAYNLRQSNNLRIADEKWVRYELSISQ